MKRSLIPLTVFLMSLSAVRAAPTIEVYTTAENTAQRLSAGPTLALAPAEVVSEKNEYVYVDATKAFQTLIGIGGALTDAAAETWAKLPAAKQRELIRAYYDPRDGIGYTLGRTSIHSCDFSSDSFTYVADGDKELKTFSIAHDERYRLPLIKAAIAAAGGKLTLFASPWSPPAWMKDSGNMLQGGKLKPEFADAWANYYVAFIHAYEKAGIPIWGLTVQNEPLAVQTWESCVFGAEEERDFVRDHLGPTLARNQLGDRKLMIWDHNRTLMYHRAAVALDDPAAAKYIWGVAFHWYVNDSFDNVRLVQQAYPRTHLLLTEACLYPYDRAKLGEWHWGEAYGTAILHDLNNGAEGWTDWNILLDETGGPNHVGNFCYAPIHADTKTGELMYMNSFYYIGHFAKFIRPGAQRIVSSPSIDTLQTTAWKNPDGSLAVVVLNTTDKDQPFTLSLGGKGTAATQSPAHSIVTLLVRN
jgi:glucosylceramidase